MSGEVEFQEEDMGLPVSNASRASHENVSMADWMVKNGFAKTTQGAEYILLGSACAAIVIAVLIYLFSSTGFHSRASTGEIQAEQAHMKAEFTGNP